MTDSRKLFDVENFVYKHFYDVLPTTNTYGQKELRVPCFSCGETGKKLYINPVTGSCQCFKCGYRSRSVFILVQDVTGASKEEVKRMIQEGMVENPALSWTSFKEKIYGSFYPVQHELRPCTLPEENRPIYGNKSYTAGVAREWLYSRGISDEDIEHYRMGVCASGRYKGRVILPIYRDGELLYYNARIIGKCPDGVQKVLNPDKGDGDFKGKSEVVLNLDRASDYKLGVIVEGYFDQIITGEPAMGVMGKYLSEVQLAQIILSNFDELAVMLDPDASEHCIKMAEKLNDFIPTKVVLLPGGDEGLDPADLGREKCWDYILNSQPIDLKLKIANKLN